MGYKCCIELNFLVNFILNSALTAEISDELMFKTVLQVTLLFALISFETMFSFKTRLGARLTFLLLKIVCVVIDIYVGMLHGFYKSLICPF